MTRRDILEGKKSADTIVRACLVVANNLNKSEEENWLKKELSGYNSKNVIPLYRNIPSNVETRGGTHKGFDNIDLLLNIHYYTGVLNSVGEHKLIHGRKDGDRNIVYEPGIRSFLDSVVDACLYFLNDTISELQYGGVVEYLMEEIRKNTDEKLIALDPSMGSEIQSLFSNLTSTNKADWNKVGHSCRKLLKLVADKVFPPSDDMYTFKDKTTREVKENMYINRLCAFIDQKTSDYERAFELSEINYFEKYLRESNEFDNVGEHKESIEKYQADMMAIHTYLIISEILRHNKV